MKLTSRIQTYDARWPSLFEAEAGRIRPIFGRACLAVHHVGSTAVPGLVAKPEIDILVEVFGTSDLEQWSRDLHPLGYRRGGDLTERHHFFKRDVEGVRTHKIHVCETGHAQIMRMLMIRDHLRRSERDRSAYAALKLRLEYENTDGIAEYLKGKAPFLDDLYRKIKDG